MSLLFVYDPIELEVELEDDHVYFGRWSDIERELVIG